MRKTPAKLDLTGTGCCASFNFRRTARAVTRLFDEALQETGIRSTQFAVLVGIAKEQPVPVGALGEVLALDSTTLTRSLRVLKNDGLIDISDRGVKRQRFLTLTAKGEQILARSLPAWRAAQTRFVKMIGDKHWGELRNELERIAHIVVKLEESEIKSPFSAPALP